jgi:hypothetical protein
MSIEAFTVVYNTPKLLYNAVGSFKKFYPNVHLNIFNNSEPSHPCTDAILDIQERVPNISSIHYGKNMGHGFAFHDAMETIESDYIYYFDSDTVMLRGGALEGLYALMGHDTYGAGKIICTAMNGKGIPKDFTGEKLRYLYLVAGMLNKDMYFKFHKWTKFGLIAYKAMVDINKNGNPDSMLKEFPIFHYVKHLSGGTRSRFGDCEDIVDGFRGRKGDMTSELD